MKYFKLFFTTFLTVFLFSTFAFAQDGGPDLGIFGSIIQFIAPMIASFAQAHPVMLSIVAGIGVFRLVFKALFGFLHGIADATPSDWDNKKLDDVEKSAWYKGFSWILDYIFSIKLDKPKS